MCNYELTGGRLFCIFLAKKISVKLILNWSIQQYFGYIVSVSF